MLDNGVFEQLGRPVNIDDPTTGHPSHVEVPRELLDVLDVRLFLDPVRARRRLEVDQFSGLPRQDHDSVTPTAHLQVEIIEHRFDIGEITPPPRLHTTLLATFWLPDSRLDRYLVRLFSAV